jgi:hypothetical protein
MNAGIRVILGAVVGGATFFVGLFVAMLIHPVATIALYVIVGGFGLHLVLNSKQKVLRGWRKLAKRLELRFEGGDSRLASMIGGEAYSPRISGYYRDVPVAVRASTRIHEQVRDGEVSEAQLMSASGQAVRGGAADVGVAKKIAPVTVFEARVDNTPVPKVEGLTVLAAPEIGPESSTTDRQLAQVTDELMTYFTTCRHRKNTVAVIFEDLLTDPDEINEILDDLVAAVNNVRVETLSPGGKPR